jgi:hypothetical protein
MAKAKEVLSPSVKYKEVIYAVQKISSLIVEVEKDGQRLKYKLHNIALSIVTAWGKKQIDGAGAADYFTALGKAAGYHGKALATWVGVKTPLEYSEEKKVWFCKPDVTVNGDAFKACRDEPFWELSPPPAPVPFNALALLEALLSKNVSKAADAKKVREGDKLLSNATIAAIRAAIQAEKAGEEPAN